MQLVVLVMSVAVVTVVLSRSKLLRPVRQALKGTWLGRLVSCAFCTSIWVAFVHVPMAHEALPVARVFTWGLADGVVVFLIRSFALAGLAAPAVWLVSQAQGVYGDAA